MKRWQRCCARLAQSNRANAASVATGCVRAARVLRAGIEKRGAMAQMLREAEREIEFVSVCV